MLEYFYRVPRRLRELRRKPLADHIEALAEKLRRCGFTRGSGQRILNLIGKFNDFSRTVGIENAEDIDEGLIQRFYEKELPSRGSFRDAPTIMRHVTNHLRERGVLRQITSAESIDPFEPILHRYDSHLHDVRGLSDGSRAAYLRYARRLLGWFRDRCGDRPLAELKGVDVMEWYCQVEGVEAAPTPQQSRVDPHYVGARAALAALT